MIIGAIRWHILLSVIGSQIPIARLYGWYCIGMFFNLFLPTAMGGDVVRIFKFGKYTGRTFEGAATVLVPVLKFWQP